MNHNEENQSTEIDRSPLTFTDLKRWLGLLVLLISAALLAWALKSILLLFAVVFLVAMVLNPIVAFLQRRRIHRGLAVALLALALVAVFALALSFLIPPLLTQVDELIRQTPKAWNRVQAQVQAFGQRYPSIQQAIPEADKVLDTVGARAGDLLGLLYKSSFRVVGGLFGSVFAVLLLAFVLINPQPLVVRFLTLVPDHYREASRRTLLRLTQQMAAWARGVVINGTISAVTTGLLLWFIGCAAGSRVWIYSVSRRVCSDDRPGSHIDPSAFCCLEYGSRQVWARTVGSAFCSAGRNQCTGAFYLG